MEVEDKLCSGTSVAVEGVTFTLESEKFSDVNNLFTMATKYFRGCPEKTKNHLLTDVSAYFPAGTSTLVVGPPACGKSLLMKVIAQRIANVRGLEGNISLSKKPANQTIAQQCTYVGQDDIHNPFTTVSSIFKFANSCSTKGLSGAAGKVEEIVDRLLLNDVAEDVIGNDLIRGISGGEKKRVTIGEMLFTDSSVLLFDEITNGLDSYAALKIVKSLVEDIKEKNAVGIFVLLQPSADIFEHFDNVLMLAEGQVLFSGPCEEAVPYFESIGYSKAPNREIPEYLGDMCTALRIVYKQSEDVDINLGALVNEWKRSDQYKTMEESINNTTSCSDKSEVSQEEAYKHSRCEEVLLLMRRELSLLYAERVFWIVLLLGVSTVAVVVGLIYLNSSFTFSNALDVEWYQHRISATIGGFVLTFLSPFASAPIVFVQKEIFFKQRDEAFFRTSSFVFVTVLFDIIPRIFESLLTSLLLFFMVPMADVDEKDAVFVFLIFWSYFLSFAVMNMQFVRLLSYVYNGLASAMTAILGCFALGFLFNGFNPPESVVSEVLQWAFWLNPFCAAARGVINTIFKSDSFTGLSPVFFETLQLRDEDFWFWLGYVYIGVFTVALIVVQYIVLEFFRFKKKKRTVLSEGEKLEYQRRKTERKSLRLQRKSLRKTQIAQMKKKKNTMDKLEEEQRRIYKESKFKPVTLLFKDVSYFVKTKKDGEKQLLKNLSGYAEPGEMTALMGASGAGKTTLLDVLGDRKTEGRVEGEILFNNSKKKVPNLIAYVEQADIHSPNITVEEALMFSSKLRSGASIETVESLVRDTIKTLNLGDVEDIPTQYLSLNELKRVTIGVELVSNPSVCFCDEPTTSLTSQDAEKVIEAIANIVKQGRTVVCTIHQPSAFIFSRFDRVFLLKRGGEMVYFGRADEAKSYFEQYKPSPRASYNAADLILDAVEESESQDIDLVAEFANHEYARDAASRMEKIEKDDSVDTNYFEGRNVPEYYKFFLLLERYSKIHWRSAFNLARIGTGVVVSLLTGVLYYQQGVPNSLAQAAGILYSYFFLLFFASLIFALSPLATVFGERKVFYRERPNKMYNPLHFVGATFLVELFYTLVCVVLMWNIYYFMVGLRNEVNAYLVGFLVTLSYMMFNVMLAYAVAAALPTIQLVAIVTIVVTTLGLYFSGVFISVKRIDDYLSWYRFLCPIFYSANGFVASQFHCDSCVADLNFNGTCNNGLDCDTVCDQQNPGCKILSVNSGTPGFDFTFTTWSYYESAGGYDGITYPMVGAVAGFMLFYLVSYASNLSLLNVIKR